MAYQPTKPQAGDQLSVSQGDIQQNFEVANNVFAKDHYAFNASPTILQGKSKQTTFVRQNPVPAPADEEESLIYGQTVTDGLTASYTMLKTRVYQETGGVVDGMPLSPWCMGKIKRYDSGGGTIIWAPDFTGSTFNVDIPSITGTTGTVGFNYIRPAPNDQFLILHANNQGAQRAIRVNASSKTAIQFAFDAISNPTLPWSFTFQIWAI